jgi:hypothetical protein
VPPFHEDDRVTVHHGDCLDVLRTLPDCSVDSVVTDPPAGVAFMGKDWDTDKGGRDAWVAWLASVLAECRRILKPGGHALVWALPRTSGWTHRAIEDAGLDVRDCITHLFGSGFPKSLDVGKAIDRRGTTMPTGPSGVGIRAPSLEAAGLGQKEAWLRTGPLSQAVSRVAWPTGRALQLPHLGAVAKAPRDDRLRRRDGRRGVAAQRTQGNPWRGVGPASSGR